MKPARRARTRTLQFLAVGALALALCLIGASGAAAKKAPKSFFGVVPWGSFKGQDYQRLVKADVHNARTPFYWFLIEPSPGSYDWASTDRFVGSAARYHVRVLPFLYGSPSWVTKNQARLPAKSKSRAKWKRFVKACVHRYGRHGKFWRQHPGLPKLPITTWQIWNEQNNTKYAGPRPKPKKYAKLVKTSHRAARSKDRHAKIVLGGMFGNPKPKHSASASSYLRKMYKVKGLKRSFNDIAVHPYAPTIHSLKHQVSKLHKVVKRRHDNAKTWITEMGWGSAPPSKKAPLLKGVQGQKRMLKKSFRVLLHHRHKWKLKRVYWFMWRDASPQLPTNCSFCHSAGLFTYNFQPKPSWHAFKGFTRR